MMEWELAVSTYLIAVAFMIIRNNLTIANGLTKNFECHKEFDFVEYYECEADDYFAFKSIDGKRFLFVGEDPNSHAYYHELGHLIFDNFLLDPFLEASILFPLFLLPVPWAWAGALFMYIIMKWVKKNRERRADIFAYEMTKQKYTPTKLEEGKLQLLFRWLFWSHPPEKIRVEEEYYKKEVSLIKLFFKSIFSS